MRDMRTASNEYQLGRLGRLPRDMDSWTVKALADYNDGKADRTKIRRQQNRKRILENILEGIIAVIAVIGLILAWAFVTALPFLMVIGFLALIGVI